MNQLTLEWVSKAEGDYDCVLREWRARKRPNYDALCFHAQQCAEKYMKACLIENDIPFIKTHNLVFLMEKLLTLIPDIENLRGELNSLNQYAVVVRYPGGSADKEISRESLTTCRMVRERCRQFLGLENGGSNSFFSVKPES